MIISHKYKFIFIKTQKTAGTSIEICLSKYLGAEDVITPVSPPDEIIRKKYGGKGPQNHDELSYLPFARALWRRLKNNRNVFSSHMPIEHLSRLKINLPDYEIVTVSRNPWEVNASLYVYEKNKRPEKVKDDFNDWVFKKGIENFDKLKINGKYSVDTVLLFSNLDHDYSDWVKKTGLPDEASEQLKKINAKSGIRPKGLDYFSLYNNESKKYVEDTNQYEIRQFGYKFEKP